MLVVLPFHAGDLHQAVNLVAWLAQVRGGTAYSRHRLLLLADAGVDWFAARKLLQTARPLFANAELLATETSVTGWPQGANALFAAACQYSGRAQAPWLWLEPDAVPLHPEWLDLIAHEYAACGRPFMGNIYGCAQPNLPHQMLSGVAVYPSSVSYTPHPTIAFDVTLAPVIVPQAAHTVRIQHLWGEPDLPPTFPRHGEPMPRNGFTFAKLQGNAVLFHRNKDGTLIERLREQRGIAATPHSALHAPHSLGFLKVRRTASIGDSLSATVVVKKLTMLGYDCQYQTQSANHCVMRRIPGIKHLCDPHGTVDIDLDGAYENHKGRKKFHFAQMWVDRANESLRSIVIPDARNFAPRMQLQGNDRTDALEVFRKYPRPWTVICPRSHHWANRTVPDEIWSRAAAQIKGTKFWLALHPAPHSALRTPHSAIVDLSTRHFDRAIGFLGTADLLVTVDTGPMHVAAALGTPVVAIQQASSPELHLSDQQDFVMISPQLGCLNCQLDLCPINPAVPPCQQIDPGLIARAANDKLRSVTDDGVSVVISIYRPDVRKLNRALEHILPQVQEIVVVVDQAGHLPADALVNPKVRYLKLPLRDVGLARKANYGFRHTNEKYLLWLNDDCYMAPDAVAKLREVMGPQVGLVGCELRYPDGTLQHGGTYRPIGSFGWGHLDWKARESRIQAPLEMENVTGACVLIRRKAFYEAGGLDENFYLYCEDNDLCLSVRRAGWKVFYTPHAKGIHEESQSTSITPNIREIMDRSNRYLLEKWRFYFDLNHANTGMGVFE